MKPLLFALTIFFCRFVAAQDVTFTANNCISGQQERGSIEFRIDTTYHKGPFLVRFEYPDGRIDTMQDFTEPFHRYEGLPPGRYCIDIQCCAACSASGCIDVLNYKQMLSGEVSVLWAGARTPPDTDSTAILLVCTEIEEEEEIVCSAVFLLYTPPGMQHLPIRGMIEKALASLPEIRENGYLEEYRETNPDVWLADPFKVLFRFDANGRIKWAYSQ